VAIWETGEWPEKWTFSTLIAPVFIILMTDTWRVKRCIIIIIIIIIILLPKKDDLKQCANYRTIEQFFGSY